MIGLMEQQRHDCTGVGGFCQLTTLTEHSITQRILRRWPISVVDQLPPSLIGSLTAACIQRSPTHPTRAVL
jgi:hypothetical protein